MQRAYQTITPANNQFLKRKWDQQLYARHRRKVETIQPVIDNKPPKTYLHLHLNLKKLQMEEERMAIVERDNRILLDQMAYMMKTGGRVDNKNYYKKRSLNKTKRQRELLQITHENQAILKRIKSKQPNYNHMQFEQQWRANQGYCKNISRYPQLHKNAKNPKPKKVSRSSDGQKKETASQPNAPVRCMPDVCPCDQPKCVSPQNHSHTATDQQLPDLPAVD